MLAGILLHVHWFFELPLKFVIIPKTVHRTQGSTDWRMAVLILHMFINPGYSTVRMIVTLLFWHIELASNWNAGWWGMLGKAIVACQKSGGCRSWKDYIFSLEWCPLLVCFLRHLTLCCFYLQCWSDPLTIMRWDRGGACQFLQASYCTTKLYLLPDFLAFPNISDSCRSNESV